MKKAITACLGLLAFAAFIVPATASATNDPQVTHPLGTLLAKGAKITATALGGKTTLEDTNGNPLVTCTTASMTGELTKNEASTVEGKITAAAFSGSGPGGRCTGIFNAFVDPIVSAAAPWCLKSGAAQATDEFVVLGGTCGAPAKIEFKLTTEVGTVCEYVSTSTTAVKGTYTTSSTGDAILSTPRTGSTPTVDSGFSEKEPKKILCPDSGSLRMSFTLETDKEGVAEPLYIS